MNTAAESSSFERGFSGTNENKALQHSLSDPSGKEKLLTEPLKREFALLKASFQRCVSGNIICVWYFQYFLCFSGLGHVDYSILQRLKQRERTLPIILLQSHL